MSDDKVWQATCENCDTVLGTHPKHYEVITDSINHYTSASNGCTPDDIKKERVEPEGDDA